ncbi:MAG TPA: hypothetical protein VLV83_11900 [Acidobacteriota bacterium]|nr:hypothetical protein [Acidobacteriota bacterium]
MQKKRTRRKAAEIEKLRNKILKIVKREKDITLTNLVRQYGASIGIRNTPSDKNLAKRQLDILAKGPDIQFNRQGRDLVAQYKGEEEKPAEAAESRESAEGAPTPVAEALAEGNVPAVELDVIKAYARQVEEFSKTLQRQIATLVRMVDRASAKTD